MQASAATATPLRIVVVEDDETARLGLVETLERVFGQRVVAQAANGLEMVEVALKNDFDVIVFDVHLPQLNGFDAFRRICEQKRVAGVAITGDHDASVVRRACTEGIQGFLVKPIDPHQIGPTIELAHARFHEHQQLMEVNSRLEKSLESRKLIERAKGVLMRRHRWTEADAFRRLQRAAMNRRTSMAELARQILDGKETDL